MVYRSFLAPIDGYTDLPFRLLCQKYGAEAACVPLVNSTAIARNPLKMKRVDAHPDEHNLGIQLVGNSPESVGMATKAITGAMPFVSWLNLNCGCPMVRTVKSGGGSALLKQPALVVKLLDAMKRHSAVPVTAKIRIKDDLAGTTLFCRQLERAGADFLIIHGRTPGQGYSGKADWELIKALHEKLEVPLVGNGDIQSAAEGRALIKNGYCDSFMAGRGAMANPMLFTDRTPGPDARIALLREYLELHRRYRGEPPLQRLKLKAFNLLKGVPEAAALRNSIARAASVEEILALGKN
jgi:tRNA-dihydrouridine synthase B